MGDQDPISADIDEADIRDQVTRRHLLIGGAAVAGAVGVGAGLLGQDEDTEPTPAERLTAAEKHFVALATSLDESDVANPNVSDVLRDKVEGTLNSVNQILSEDFSDEPEITHRLTALRTAAEYYSTLLTSLAAASSISSSVGDSEPNVLMHTGELDYEPASKLDTNSFEQTIAQLVSAEKTSSAVTSQGRKLVPDQQVIVNALRTQRDVVHHHIRAQQAFLESATAIEAAVQALDHSHFDDAQSALAAAQDALPSGIAGTNGEYQVSRMGMSLDQYNELFALRQSGVAQLRDVSQESVPTNERRSAVNSALNTFFEARNLISL